MTRSVAVSFISALYAGSISDKHITEVCGLLDLLESGDVVMVDKGFLIDDLLNPLQYYLVIPHFLAKKKQLSSAETDDKTVANLRVHVERANRQYTHSSQFSWLRCVACLIV